MLRGFDSHIWRCEKRSCRQFPKRRQRIVRKWNGSPDNSANEFEVHDSSFQEFQRWRCGLSVFSNCSIWPTSQMRKRSSNSRRKKKFVSRLRPNRSSRKRCCSRCCGIDICATSGDRNSAKVFSIACRQSCRTRGLSIPLRCRRKPHSRIESQLIGNNSKSMSQRERDLILKISGFSEKAWGARGVYLGSDLSQPNGAQLSKKHCDHSQHRLTSCKNSTNPVWPKRNTSISKRTKLSPCPAACVFAPTISSKAKATPRAPLSVVVLATICPADKKIIHGMSTRDPRAVQHLTGLRLTSDRRRKHVASGRPKSQLIRFADINALYGIVRFQPAVATVTVALIACDRRARRLVFRPPRTTKNHQQSALGPEQSSYWQFATNYQHRLATNHITLSILTSRGSQENLATIRTATRSTSPLFESGITNKDSTSSDNITPLGSVGYQPLLISYRSETNYTLVVSIQGQAPRCWRPGSGTRIFAMNLLSTNGVTPQTPGLPGYRSVIGRESIAGDERRCCIFNRRFCACRKC